MATIQSTISPVDGRVYVERPYATAAGIESALALAVKAQHAWKRVPVAERIRVVNAFAAAFEKRRDRIAEESLADLDAGPKSGFRRFVRREPLGVVLTIAAWNYPYLIAVNSVVPAILAGNAVILKHSAQTPLCAERFAECFEEAGLPAGVYQFVHATHADTERLIVDQRIAFVAFTGSVAGAHAIQKAAAS